jgi:hypothetical protein
MKLAMIRRAALLCALYLGMLNLTVTSGPQASQKKAQQRKPAPRASAAKNSQGLSVSDVRVKPTSFNPSRGDKLDLYYTLSRKANVTINVYDADLQLVRTIRSSAERKAGQYRDMWDGKDMDGKVVPNEAYFFCIEAVDDAGQRVVYDPVTFSGGEFADITHGQVSRQRGTVSYSLSRPSRVLLRAGVPGGSLLKTVVDWEPRTAGEVTEYWNGKDEDGAINVWGIKNHTMVLTYMTLPESSVITFGNTAYDFREYKSGLGTARPRKENRPMTNARRISPHFFKPRLTDRTFKVDLAFPELDKVGSGIPTIKDRILVRVDVPQKDREVLINHQYEIIMFVDTVFHAEEERGYLPFNYMWELKDLPAGEHVLTTNIITFGDQIGVGSRKIRVVK